MLGRLVSCTSSHKEITKLEECELQNDAGNQNRLQQGPSRTIEGNLRFILDKQKMKSARDKKFGRIAAMVALESKSVNKTSRHAVSNGLGIPRSFVNMKGLGKPGYMCLGGYCGIVAFRSENIGHRDPRCCMLINMQRDQFYRNVYYISPVKSFPNRPHPLLAFCFPRLLLVWHSRSQSSGADPGFDDGGFG